MLRLAVALVLVLAASPVLAQSSAKSNPPSPTERIVLRLDYSGVPGCSDPESFRIALIPKITDWDPIDDTGRWRLVVSVKRRAPGFEGSAEVHDPQGALVWSTSMPPQPTMPPLPTCRTLLGYLAEVLAIWMDPPEGFPTPPAPPTHAPVCAPSPTPAEPSKCEDMTDIALRLKAPPSEPTPPAPKPLSFWLGTATWIGQITTSRADIGITLDAGVRYKLFAAAIEARGDPPLAPTPLLSGGSANYTRAAGALLVCMHYGWFVGCAKGEAARVFALGNVVSPPYLYGATGLRLGLDFPVVPQRFALRVAAEVLETIKPPSITVKTTTLFQVAQNSESVGLGAVVLFDVR